MALKTLANLMDILYVMNDIAGNVATGASAGAIGHVTLQTLARDDADIALTAIDGTMIGAFIGGWTRAARGAEIHGL